MSLKRVRAVVSVLKLPTFAPAARGMVVMNAIPAFALPEAPDTALMSVSKQKPSVASILSFCSFGGRGKIRIAHRSSNKCVRSDLSKCQFVDAGEVNIKCTGNSACRWVKDLIDRCAESVVPGREMAKDQNLRKCSSMQEAFSGI